MMHSYYKETKENPEVSFNIFKNNTFWESSLNIENTKYVSTVALVEIFWGDLQCYLTVSYFFKQSDSSATLGR